jgi:endonuclease YncB( thermonuclease family)
MRKSILVALGLGGLAGLVLAVALNQPAPPPAPSKPESLLASPTPTAQPPVAAAPPESAPASAAAVPAARPPVTATPDLPTIAVAERPVHTVPDEIAPAPKVTLFDRNGKEQTSREAMATPPPPAPSRASPSSPAAAPFAPATVFGGPAQAAGGVTLAVAGQSVQLFGVRVADPRDRCALGFGDSRSCADVARDTLAQRLKRYPIVQCHMPPGQRGNPAAICIDNSGTDLSGFLIAEGLALADLGQSYEYLGAEGVARSFRRGLWHNR